MLHLFLLSVVAIVGSIVYAAGIAVHRGSVPVGDNAFFAIRARDVFSQHLPLLGTGTSVSVTAKASFNNLGPLYFDILAVPVALFGSAAGLVIGTASINCLAVLGIAAVAYRRGGPGLGAASMVVTATLCWAMGSQVLLEPTQPSGLVLPFLCFVMLVWSVTCGDLTAVPWAVGVGSLVLMTYLTYSYLVVALSAWGALGLFLWFRTHSASVLPSRRALAGTGAISCVVLVACWIQPIIEQLTRTGNASRLLQSLNDPGLDPLGFAIGTRLVAKVIALPPWWVRPSFRHYLSANERGVAHPSSAMGLETSPSLLLALCSLTVVVVVLGWCAYIARRRSDERSNRAVTTAAVLLAAGLLTAGRMPVGVFGFVTSHTFRWLWPSAAFITLAIGLTVSQLWRPLTRPATVAAIAVVTTVLTAVNLPTSNQGALEDNSPFPVVRDLGRQLGPLKGKGPILIVPPRTFHEPYIEGVWAQMQRVGIPFVTDDPFELQQLGPRRKFTGTNARVKVLLVRGSQAPAGIPGARRFAVSGGLNRQDSIELRSLSQAVARYIGAHGLHVNEQGRRAAQAGEIPQLSATPPLSATQIQAVLSRLRSLPRQGFLSLDRTWTSRFNRYLDLSKRDGQEVALYMAPIDPGQPL